MDLAEIAAVWIVMWSFLIRGYDSAHQAPPRQVPCDKTRKIFTESWGVISDGPMGSNYTQDSHCEWLIKGRILSLLKIVHLGIKINTRRSDSQTDF